MTQEFTDNQNGEETPKPVTQQDLDNLRSIKDTEIADVQRQLRELQDSMNAGVIPGNVAAILAEVAELEDLDETEGKVVYNRAKRIAAALGAEVQSYNTTLGKLSSFAKEQAATAMALELAAELGGDYKEYKAKLMKSDKYPAMQVAAKELRVDLKEAKGAKSSNAEGNVKRVDEGSGGVAASERAKVREELAAIDVSTPEGAAEFAKKEAEFKKKIAALNR